MEKGQSPVAADIAEGSPPEEETDPRKLSPGGDPICENHIICTALVMGCFLVLIIHMERHTRRHTRFNKMYFFKFFVRLILSSTGQSPAVFRLKKWDRHWNDDEKQNRPPPERFSTFRGRLCLCRLITGRMCSQYRTENGAVPPAGPEGPVFSCPADCIR